VDAYLQQPSVRIPGHVVCTACEHRCSLGPGETGTCGARRNVDGRLRLLGFGRASSLAPGSIEEVPFAHVRPGERILSVGTVGCPLHCPFCERWTMSQWRGDPERAGFEMPPERLVARCEAAGAGTVVFTENEPVVAAEYAIETARLAHPRGIGVALSSSGFETNVALDKLEAYVDAINVDLKAFHDVTYLRLGGRLGPVLRNLERLVASPVWLEVTTTVVPGMNDTDRELRRIAGFLSSLSPDLPWHLRAFHPDHRWLDRPATPAATLLRARAIGLEAGLRFVYDPASEHGGTTWCAACGEPVVQRARDTVVERWGRSPGTCRCGASVPGRWGGRLPPTARRDGARDGHPAAAAALRSAPRVTGLGAGRGRS
jgi:pyruvate formate lyase activating enzyme